MTTTRRVGLLAAATLALASGTARATDDSYPYFKDVYNKGIYGNYDEVVGYIYGVPKDYGSIYVTAKAKVSYVYACKKQHGNPYPPGLTYSVKDKYISTSYDVAPDKYYYFDLQLSPPMYCPSKEFYPVLACIKYFDKKVSFPYDYKYISADAKPDRSETYELGKYYPYNYKCKEVGVYPYSGKSK